MSGFLFHDIIFGPVVSRRLGLSLGINLLPVHVKHCSFNCIYCECGWSPVEFDESTDYPSIHLVLEFLERKLMELAADNYFPDALTFAGNGEPTLHPDFEKIIDETIKLRDKYVPHAKVSVLSNASKISDPGVFNALLKVDNNILKLDAGTQRVFNRINDPYEEIDLNTLVENLKRFNGKVIIQSMFLQGHLKGEPIDNTSEEEVDAWLSHLVAIRPSMVMIYTIARATPLQDLRKMNLLTLENIAGKVRALGIMALVYQ